jgi:hypothetical protein
MANEEPHHTSYEKIVERPEQWGLDAAGYRALKKSPWVVTEKIHGANFALIVEGAQVRCAKRKALLEEGEDSSSASTRRRWSTPRASRATCRAGWGCRRWRGTRRRASSSSHRRTSGCRR